jgi:hypothetical protein
VATTARTAHPAHIRSASADDALWAPPRQPAFPEEAEEFGLRLGEVSGADAEPLCERRGFRARGQYSPKGGPPLWPRLPRPGA